MGCLLGEEGDGAHKDAFNFTLDSAFFIFDAPRLEQLKRGLQVTTPLLDAIILILVCQLQASRVESDVAVVQLFVAQDNINGEEPE